MTYDDAPPAEQHAECIISPRERDDGATIEWSVEVDRIGRGAGGLAVYAARVRRDDHGRAHGRAVLALDRGHTHPLAVRVRVTELPRLIEALQAAQRELDAYEHRVRVSGSWHDDRQTDRSTTAQPAMTQRLGRERSLSEDEAALCGVAPRPKKRRR